MSAREPAPPGVSEEVWAPAGTLALLGIGFLAAIALAIVVALTTTETFAVGLAIFGAVVMAVGFLLGFGPLRRV
jgi:hypothetical protein